MKALFSPIFLQRILLLYKSITENITKEKISLIRKRRKGGEAL